MYPEVVIFDFHGTISLKQGTSPYSYRFKNFEETLDPMEGIYLFINDLKKVLRKYKLPNETKTDWYQTMNRSKINPVIMIPFLDDLIKLVESFPDSMYFIASMLETDDFIHDMLKYSFEMRGKVSPFTYDKIIGTQTLNKYRDMIKNEEGKLAHMDIIFTKFNLYDVPRSNIVVIDDSDSTISLVKSHGYCGIFLDSLYFRLDVWNKNICGYDKILDIPERTEMQKEIDINIGETPNRYGNSVLNLINRYK
jgi:hypothetical protein